MAWEFTKMDNQNERIREQRWRSSKEAKRDHAKSEIRIEFLGEMTVRWNVNIATIWETLDI